MKMYASPSSRCSSSSRLTTWACTDTSSADTGSSQMITFGLSATPAGDADPLPLAAGELVRVAVDVLRVEPDQVEQLLHPAAAGRPCGTTSGWISNGSPMMSPTVIRGFSEVYGSWKTIWMSRRSRRIAAPCWAYMSTPSKVTLPAVGSSSRISSPAERRLAAAGLADDAEGLALVELEGRPRRRPSRARPSGGARRP